MNDRKKIAYDRQKIREQRAVDPVLGQPETAEELINKYGTYNIQPTADSDNEFPTIGQGFPHIKEDSDDPEKEQSSSS